MAQLSTETEMKYILDRSSASTIFAPYARLLLSEGHVHEARTMAERGVLANPRYVTGHLVLAEAFKAEHDYRQALTQLMIALRYEPTHFGALQLAYQIFKLSGEKAAAAGILQLILRCNPHSALAKKHAHLDYGMTIKEILSKVEEVHATRMHDDVVGSPMVMNTMLDVEEEELRDIAIDLPSISRQPKESTLEQPQEFSLNTTVTDAEELSITSPTIASIPSLPQPIKTNSTISLDPDEGDVPLYEPEENVVSLGDLAQHLNEEIDETAPVSSLPVQPRHRDATITLDDDLFALPNSDNDEGLYHPEESENALSLSDLAHQLEEVDEHTPPSVLAPMKSHDMDATISLEDDIFAQVDSTEEIEEEPFDVLDEALSESLDELVGELHLHDEEEYNHDQDSFDHGLDLVLEPLVEQPEDQPILEKIEAFTPPHEEQNDNPFAELRDELSQSLTVLGGHTQSPTTEQPFEHSSALADSFLEAFETVPQVAPTPMPLQNDIAAPVAAPVKEVSDEDPFAELRNELADSLTVLGGTTPMQTITPPPIEPPTPVTNENRPTPVYESFEPLGSDDPFADLRNELAESLTNLSAPTPPEVPEMELYFNALAPTKTTTKIFPPQANMVSHADLEGDDDHHDEKTIAFAMPVLTPQNAPQEVITSFHSHDTASLLSDVGAAIDALSNEDPEATLTLRTSETYQKAPDIFSTGTPFVEETPFVTSAWEDAPNELEPIADTPAIMESAPIVQPQTLESAFSKLKTELSSYFEADSQSAQPSVGDAILTPPAPFIPSSLGDDSMAEETYEMTTPLGSLSFSTHAEVEEILSENNLESEESSHTETFAKPPVQEEAEKVDVPTFDPAVPEKAEEPPIPSFSVDSLPEHVITTTYADLYLQQDQPEMARSIYERILQKNPDNEVAQQRLENLQKTFSAGDTTPREIDSSQAPNDLKPLAGKKIKVAIRKKLKGQELDE